MLTLAPRLVRGPLCPHSLHRDSRATLPHTGTRRPGHDDNHGGCGSQDPRSGDRPACSSPRGGRACIHSVSRANSAPRLCTHLRRHRRFRLRTPGECNDFNSNTPRVLSRQLRARLSLPLLRAPGCGVHNRQEAEGSVRGASAQSEASHERGALAPISPRCERSRPSIQLRFVRNWKCCVYSRKCAERGPNRRRQQIPHTTGGKPLGWLLVPVSATVVKVLLVNATKGQAAKGAFFLLALSYQYDRGPVPRRMRRSVILHDCIPCSA